MTDLSPTPSVQGDGWRCRRPPSDDRSRLLTRQSCADSLVRVSEGFRISAIVGICADPAEINAVTYDEVPRWPASSSHIPATKSIAWRRRISRAVAPGANTACPDNQALRDRRSPVAAGCGGVVAATHEVRCAAETSPLTRWTSLTEAYLNAAGLKLFEGAAELAAASD